MARLFNGTSDLINIPTAVSLPANSPVTVAFWNYVTSAVASAAFTIGSSESPHRCSSHAPWSDGVLYWDYGNFSGNGRISTSYSSYLNKWTHVGLVSAGSGGSFKAIYLNGAAAASSTGASDGPTVGLSGGIIGAWPALYHTGRLGHFAAWTAQLSANEVAMLYAGVTPTRVRPGNLLVYYPFWGLGSAEADLSGGANNGVLTGTTVVSDPPVGSYAPVTIDDRYSSRGAAGSPAPVPMYPVSQYGSFH